MTRKHTIATPAGIPRSRAKLTRRERKAECASLRSFYGHKVFIEYKDGYLSLAEAIRQNRPIPAVDPSQPLQMRSVVATYTGVDEFEAACLAKMEEFKFDICEAIRRDPKPPAFTFTPDQAVGEVRALPSRPRL